MFFFLFVAVAWATLFIPGPKWLSFIVGCVVIWIALIFVIFGWAGVVWDSHMQPGATHAKWGLIAGILMLLSRATYVIKAVIAILISPPGPP
ncbi:hypothetical protein [Dyella tabacisoli]|uniref:Uncharacterized protein n=1 Tax=Dyella tabacisoli TaxID=2282381 RepID=A0A369UTT1_9GAMM|nr:hypothetical protein [Dyella tabacisoli]RDD83010.1 hypothetical protein DVJ77_03945 [Dyella tabacisoli]